jgi:NADPH:quinone reductase-like Zn-dependent oxidoreductase
MRTVDQRNRRPRKAPAKVQTHPIRAIVHPRCGTLDLLPFEPSERRAPGDEDVLVRVRAAVASIGDPHLVTGKPYLIRLSPFGGSPRARNRVPVAIMAGRVEAVGATVTAFRSGDEVFGQATLGAFAEYVVVPAKRLALKPSNLSFEEAAGVPWTTTALQGRLTRET